MKTKQFVFLTALAISTFGLAGCSSKPQEQVTVAQGPSAYDKYKQEIADLPQKAVITNSVKSEQVQEPIVTARQNLAAYSAAVQDLQTRITNDTTVEGSATTGKKAELLAAVQRESTTNAPLYVANAINRKARDLIVAVLKERGTDALKNDGVLIGTIMRLKGPDAMSALRRGDDPSSALSEPFAS